MAISSATFEEVLETCGIDVEMFDLEENTLEDIQVFFDRQIDFARADVRRGVGSPTYDTTDHDTALQVRSAVIYLAGARALRAILNRHQLGQGPPLLIAGAADIRQLINDLKTESNSAMELAKLPTPNKTQPWGLATNGMNATDVRAHKFSRKDEW